MCHLQLLIVPQLSVNGTTVDSVTDRLNEPKFYVKENEGYIVLCVRLEFLPPSKSNLTINCSATNGTACKYFNVCRLEYYYILCITTDSYNNTLSIIIYLVTVVNGKDFVVIPDVYTFTSVGKSFCIQIPIIDNYDHDGNLFFLFGITSDCGINIWIQIFILDDEWGRLKLIM